MRTTITPDGTKAYVTTIFDNVSVIDTATNTLSTTIGVGNSPLGVAVTPDGTKAYVTNYDDATVSVINTAAALADPVDLGPTIIDDLVAKFMIDDEWIVIGNRGFDWWGGPLPLAIRTSEPTLAWGDLTVRVAATCTVVEDVRIDEDDAINLISSLTFATSGQLMGVSTAVSIGWAYDPATRSVTATTVGYFHEGNLGVLITYSAAVLLRYDEALRMAFELAKQLQGTVPQRPHPSSGLRSDTDELLGFTDEVIRPAGTDLNRYGLNDFEAASLYWSGIGLLANADDLGVTIEFPYITDLIATASTSLCMLEAVEHSEYGNGLLATLRFDQTPMASIEAARLANELNLAEGRYMTGFAALGGWAQYPTGGVYHSTFYPNAWAAPGLVATISFYSSLRSDWMRDIMMSGNINPTNANLYGAEGPATNTVSATITVGSGPHGVAITPDGTYAYVGIVFGTVSVIKIK